MRIHLVEMCIFFITATSSAMESPAPSVNRNSIPSSIFTGRHHNEKYTDFTQRHMDALKNVLDILKKPYNSITTTAILDISKEDILREDLCTMNLSKSTREQSFIHLQHMIIAMRTYPREKPLKALETTIVYI